MGNGRARAAEPWLPAPRRPAPVYGKAPRSTVGEPRHHSDRARDHRTTIGIHSRKACLSSAHPALGGAEGGQFPGRLDLPDEASCQAQSLWLACLLDVQELHNSLSRTYYQACFIRAVVAESHPLSRMVSAPGSRTLLGTLPGPRTSIGGSRSHRVARLPAVTGVGTKAKCTPARARTSPLSTQTVS